MRTIEKQIRSLHALCELIMSPPKVATKFKKHNLIATIAVLEQVQEMGGKFSLERWVDSDVPSDMVVAYGMDNPTKSVLECGTTACVMGWAASTPAWKKLGGSLVFSGLSLVPSLPVNGTTYNGFDAARIWFGMSDFLTRAITAPAGSRARELLSVEHTRILGGLLADDVGIALKSVTDMRAVQVSGTVAAVNQARLVAYAEEDPPINVVIDVLKTLRDTGHIQLHTYTNNMAATQVHRWTSSYLAGLED